MKKNANGIPPVVSTLITLVMIALTVLLFCTGHPVWGVIFALVSVDFLADAVLSFKKA